MKVSLEKSKDPNKKNRILEKNITLNFSFKSNFTKSNNRSLIGRASELELNEQKLQYLDDLK